MLTQGYSTLLMSKNIKTIPIRNVQKNETINHLSINFIVSLLLIFLYTLISISTCILGITFKELLFTY